MGLSITISESHDSKVDLVPDWLFLDDYRDGSQKKAYREVTHDTNEDRYIRVYDILEQKEIKYDRPAKQVEFYIGKVTDSSTGEVYQRVQSISAPNNESEIHEDVDWTAFDFKFLIENEVVTFYALEGDQRFETDLSFTLNDLATTYKLSLKSMSTTNLEDFISNKSYGLSDCIYVNQNDL